MTHEITNKDGVFFKKMCKKIIEEYGGSDYLWGYEIDGFMRKDRNAECTIDRQAQLRLLAIATEIEDISGDKQADITYLAFHEVMEALLGDLTTTAEARFTNQEQLEKDTHAFINRSWRVFKKFVLPKMKDKG